jgi:hypothetical protein
MGKFFRNFPTIHKVKIIMAFSRSSGTRILLTSSSDLNREVCQRKVKQIKNFIRNHSDKKALRKVRFSYENSKLEVTLESVNLSCWGITPLSTEIQKILNA